jgi:SnoaL-like domain
MAEKVTQDTMKVGAELCDMVRQGRYVDAVETFYDPEIVSIEAAEMPGSPARVEGLDAVRDKTTSWIANHEVHSQQVDGPWPNADRFIVRYRFDVTPKTGPMAGQRMQLDETGLYTVADGKVVQEEFFYDMG